MDSFRAPESLAASRLVLRVAVKFQATESRRGYVESVVG